MDTQGGGAQQRGADVVFVILKAGFIHCQEQRVLRLVVAECGVAAPPFSNVKRGWIVSQVQPISFHVHAPQPGVLRHRLQQSRALVVVLWPSRFPSAGVSDIGTQALTCCRASRWNFPRTSCTAASAPGLVVAVVE